MRVMSSASSPAGSMPQGVPAAMSASQTASAWALSIQIS